MAKIDNHKYSIDEAFRECFYVVPDYQREYVWTDKEVQQLLDDISEQVNSGTDREYFVGTVLVSQRKVKSHFEVIDGQQRLTTFFLVLSALRVLFKGSGQSHQIEGLLSTTYTTRDGETETKIKLDPCYENAGEVMRKIVATGGTPDQTRSAVLEAGLRTYGSLDRILDAYDTVFSHLNENYPDAAALKRFWGYLANEVVFIQIDTDVSSALKIFETINERGVGLDSMDLLKNLLFTQVSADDFTRLKEEWKKITDPLEKAKEKPLRFLRYFLMANYEIENARKDSIVREDEIYDWLVSKTNASTLAYSSKPFEFVRKITNNVESYLAFLDGRGNDGKPSVPIENLKRLTGEGFSLHYVLLLAARGLPKPLFDHLVTQLESFLFYYIFTKTATKELEKRFSQWADTLREIVRETNPASQKELLNRFVTERLKKDMSAKEGELKDALKRYSLSSMQKYRTKYFLSKVAQFVDMAYKGLKEPGLLGEYKGFDIEHILPDNPKPELRASFAEANPGAVYDEFKVKLGNLTLLEKPLNVVASNGYFTVKKGEYAKCKSYLTSSIPALTPVGKNSTVTRINEKLVAFDDWSAEAIDKRQDMLIGLADDIWRTTELAAS
jgi:Protein of unknown function DUF262/Protein of unknown function (DUF1524)